MQKIRLPLYNKPAHTAVTTPATRLGGKKKGLKDKLAIPPSNVDSTPRYGPKIMPITGAMTDAAVMVLPKKPITWNIGEKARTTYKAVKQAINATSIALSFLLTTIVAALLSECGS